MCIGVPGQVLAVGEDIHQLAQVEVCGIKRDVNIALICEGNPADLLGQWVLVHVGFAMSIIASESQGIRHAPLLTFFQTDCSENYPLLKWENIGESTV